MTKNKRYWQKRFELLENDRYLNSLAYIKDLNIQYKRISKRVESDISVWYQRFAKNNEITLTQAKKLLNTKELKEFKWDVNEYIRYGKANAFNSNYLKQLENVSARVHISRLESLQLQLQQQVEVLYGNRTDELDEFLSNTYSDSYYKTAYEINKGTNIAVTLQKLDINTLENLLKKPWTQDNTNFSKRIWKNQNDLINKLNTHLTQGLVLGESPDKIIRKLIKDLNVDKSKISRLVMTESAAFASIAQKDVFKDLDVEMYEIVATLDKHTSEICRSLDGHVFDMKDYEVGVTAPPFHPFVEPLLYHTLTIMTVKDSPETVVVRVFIYRQILLTTIGRNNL